MRLALQFDRSKLKAAILRICKACDPEKLGAVKLHKVLYFSDMLSYAQSKQPVTGAKYCKRPFGPTCVQLLPMLRDMQLAGELQIRDVEFYGRSKKEYVALSDEQVGVLNDAERALLDEVIKFVCHENTAQSISDFSHQLPWEMAEFGEEIRYDTALMLFPVDIEPAVFEAVEQGAMEIAQARLDHRAVDMSLLSTLRERIPAAL